MGGTEQIIPVMATAPAADAVKTGDAVSVPEGWITLAGVAPLAAGLNAALRGRIDLLGPPDATGTRKVLGSLWEDYIRAAGQPYSQPQRKVYHGWAVRLVIAGSTSWAGTAAVSATVAVSDEPPTEGVYIHRTLVGPAAGPGDVRSVAPASPAPGADPAAISIGAQTTARMRGGSSVFTPNDATARRPYVAVATAGGTHIYRGYTPQVINTAVARDLALSYNDGQTDNVTPWGQPMPLYREVIPPTFTVQLVANVIGAGEQWSGLLWAFEEWAVIA